MRQGEVIADRFEIEHLAGSGGMGRVYRALDRACDAPVALKILHAHTSYESARFTREAQALAALDRERIPGVVRYIDHGKTPDDDLYLAMEWIEGETLAERLARASLTIAESVALAHRVALALGAVHRRGYVHRDLKPSNIFLRHGSLDQVMLIDFGIARLPHVEHNLTIPGTMLGTPAFVAPEQARSAIEVDARADVFSLGCVLFKCLTGQAPFVAKDGLSVLLRVVLEDAPRLRTLRRDVPSPLDALVARMLSKDPAGRPIDGELAAQELAALSGLTATPSTLPPRGTDHGLEITTAERRVMCLVLARGAHDIALAPVERDARERALRAAIEKQKGQLEILADGSVFVLQQNAGAATDLAAQAARSALAMRALLGSAPIAVVSGRGVASSRLPVGELIDRAVDRMTRAPLGAGEIRLDDVTASLLDAEFDVGEGTAGLCLRGARDALSAPRTLLGKPTPFVGRERERSRLTRAFARTIAESEASVVLVTGPPGMGKSRLCSEFLREIRGAGDPAAIWIARGDPMSAGSAFGLLGQALRRAIGVQGGEPVEARRLKISQRVARHAREREWTAPEQARIAAFLGELIGTPFPDAEDIALRAARADPGLLGDQMRRAFEDFLGGECAAQPVLLVLEDLHWGDLPTVKFIDAALGHLKERPLMVLGLGRPDVADLFPKLWEERGLSTIELAGLPRRAAERLVQETLGDAATAETVATLVERAEGNAFYLEELIRAVAQGTCAALPETVLAMVQARLEALSVEARRALRAASIFGQTFWAAGVSALVGSRDASPWLSELVDEELCAPSREGRFPGEAEYTFRHALLREAADAMLTEADRAVGHKLAGAWLERAGEGDPIVLAEHFERGFDLSRAAACYRRAAEQAFEGNDLSAVLARADRGIACLAGDPAADSQPLGELQVLKARAHRWRGENAEAQRCASAAMRLFPHSGPAFCDAAGEVILASGKLGHVDPLVRAAEALLALGEDAPISSSRVIALSRASVGLRLAQRLSQAEALLEQAAALSLWVQGDPTVIAELLSARATRALAAGDVGDYLRLVEASRASFEQAGDLRNMCVRSLNLGYAHLQLGAFAASARVLREALGEAERLGQKSMQAYARHNLGLSLGRQGKLAEARAVEEEAVAAFRAQQDRRMEAASRIYLAMILRLSGAAPEAEREARAVAEDPATPPGLVALALATVAEARLSPESGQAAEALAAARRAMEILRELEGVEDGESLIRLVFADALAASGDQEGAKEAAREARERLLSRAGKVGDAELRASFLQNVPENARTLSLAERLLGE
jgi:eukaryotic-like serine/threonine-protein kinase